LTAKRVLWITTDWDRKAHISASSDIVQAVFKRGVQEGSFEALDSETMYTINKFFENNLNVSETSRQLMFIETPCVQTG